MRRTVDILVTVILAPILLPLAAIVALAVKLSSRGRVVYRASRLGRHGRIFTLYKFRTMVDTGPGGPLITQRYDPRLSRGVGFLRRSRLDELPQFLNILKGDMTLVGPRPEDPRFADAYAGEFAAVLEWRPGLIPPAFLIGEEDMLDLSADEIEDLYAREVLSKKLALELDYLQRRSPATDVVTALRVFARLAARRTADARVVE